MLLNQQLYDGKDEKKKWFNGLTVMLQSVHEGNLHFCCMCVVYQHISTLILV